MSNFIEFAQNIDTTKIDYSLINMQKTINESIGKQVAEIFDKTIETLLSRNGISVDREKIDKLVKDLEERNYKITKIEGWFDRPTKFILKENDKEIDNVSVDISFECRK
jgi:hypothetical protein